MNFLKNIGQMKIVACCGSGGVGKTTVSAALGMLGAMSGRKTLVLTIDPARRLADSLGLGEFGKEAQQVPAEKFGELGLRPSGELHAMMLDTKRTFDRLIEKYSASDRMRETILGNRYYQHLSSTLSGSHEYMAMEKLYEIHQDGEYDLIVLDTPPSRNAFEFLEAPERLSKLLGNNMFRKILKPYVPAGNFRFKMLSFFTSPAQKMIRTIFGSKVMDDIFNFFQLGNDLFFDGFQRRAKAVRDILSGPDVLFLAIAAPMLSPMNEALFFYERLKEYNMPFGGFIINRVHPAYPETPEVDAGGRAWERGETETTPELADKIMANYENFRKLGQSDRLAVRTLEEYVGKDAPVKQIPCLDSDVYDFTGLLRIYEHLKT